MKSIIFITACMLSIQCSFAQLKVTAVCPALVADVLGGNVNKLHPRSTAGEIQKALPCFSNVVDKADSAACAGVFYKDRGLTFYTERNYIEIADNFKGTVKPALMGATRASLFKLLGYPKLKDTNWDAFQTEYGTLVLYYNAAGKINKMQMSTRSTETLKLCE